MEVIVTQENLAKALGNVGRVASARTNLDILNNVLLRTENNQLLLAATNLEIAATQRIGAKVVKNGSFTVPARLMSEYVSSLPKGKITLTVKANSLKITSDMNTSSINGTIDEEFPELPVIDENTTRSLVIDTVLFKEASSQTIITASTDATRPVLTGVYWHTYDEKLYFAATDGYRLAEREVQPCKEEIDIIIPTSTIQEVVRTLDDSHTTMNILLDDTQVRFQVGENEITSRLIDGNFPDYRQLIPASSETSFVASTDDLKRVVRISGIFGRESGGSIVLSTDAARSVVNIQSIASEYGENSSDMTAKISGADGTVTINSRYINDVLAVLSAKELTFGFSGALAPCIITPIEKNPTYKHIIMPIKN